MSSSTSRQMLVLGFTVLVMSAAVTAPIYMSDAWLHRSLEILVLAIFASGVGLLLGEVGLPSLGHAAFYGTAAYITALLARSVSTTFWVHLALATTTVLVFGLIVGILALRGRGIYFLMISLAVAQVLWAGSISWRTLTRGDDGLPNIPKPGLGLGIELHTDAGLYYLALGIAVLALVAMQYLRQSAFGLALRGIRESEDRMSALGYNVWRLKYTAFVISAVLAGLGGVLAAYVFGIVTPRSLSLFKSVDGLLVSIIGGVGSTLGPLVGSIVLVLAEDFISSATRRWHTVLGAIFVGLAILQSRSPKELPVGVIDGIRWMRRRVLNRSASQLATSTDTSGAIDHKESSKNHEW